MNFFYCIMHTNPSMILMLCSKLPKCQNVSGMIKKNARARIMPQGIHGNSAERYIIAAKFPRDKISLSNDAPIYWQNLNLYWLSHQLIQDENFSMMLCVLDAKVRRFEQMVSFMTCDPECSLVIYILSWLYRFSMDCYTVSPSPVWVQIPGP